MDVLPVDVLYRIFCHLDSASLLKLATVSSSLNNAVSNSQLDSTLWKLRVEMSCPFFRGRSINEIISELHRVDTKNILGALSSQSIHPSWRGVLVYLKRKQTSLLKLLNYIAIESIFPSDSEPYELNVINSDKLFSDFDANELEGVSVSMGDEINFSQRSLMFLLEDENYFLIEGVLEHLKNVEFQREHHNLQAQILEQHFNSVLAHACSRDIYTASSTSVDQPKQTSTCSPNFSSRNDLKNMTIRYFAKKILQIKSERSCQRDWDRLCNHSQNYSVATSIFAHHKSGTFLSRDSSCSPASASDVTQNVSPMLSENQDLLENGTFLLSWWVRKFDVQLRESLINQLLQYVHKLARARNNDSRKQQFYYSIIDDRYSAGLLIDASNFNVPQAFDLLDCIAKEKLEIVDEEEKFFTRSVFQTDTMNVAMFAVSRFKSMLDEISQTVLTRVTEKIQLSPLQNYSKPTTEAILDEINSILFKEMKFKGAGNENYYNEENSFLDYVLTARVGIPITLAILYQAVAHRCGLLLEPTMIPMHFHLRLRHPNNTSNDIYIDVYNGGVCRTNEEILAFLSSMGVDGTSSAPLWQGICEIKHVFTRMMNNIYHVYTIQLQRMRTHQYKFARICCALLQRAFISDGSLDDYISLANMYLNLEEPELFTHNLLRIREVALTMNNYNEIKELNILKRNMFPGGVTVKRRNTEHAGGTIHAKTYRVGNVIRHKRYGYLGVIVGWEKTCQMSEQWIATMGVDRLPNGRNQWFYHVLRDSKGAQNSVEAVMCVAADNIEIVDEPTIINHRLMCRHFDSFEESPVIEYQFYIPNCALRFIYPDDVFI